MGLFSSIFGGGRKSSGIVSGRNPGKGWISANRFNKAKGGFAGGYGAITFGNIMDAHSSDEEIVEEFELDSEDCDYKHPSFGKTCYQQAYTEEYIEQVLEKCGFKLINKFEGYSEKEVEENSERILYVVSK